MKAIQLLYLVCGLLFPISSSFTQNGQMTIPISAPLTSDSPGKMGIVACQSVFRVIDTKNGTTGTGFLHKSGWIITAAHVISNCSPSEILLLLPDGRQIAVDSTLSNLTLDLGLLKPSAPISGASLSLSNATQFPVGAMVTTWGFPSGYNSPAPLLTVGYLAGTDQVAIPSGLSAQRWVVNAAFNSGNSGGPVLDVEHGEVIGVVSSKLAPIPAFIQNALEALSKQPYGFTYTDTRPDGSTISISEGQLIAEILKYLRSQTQLVLGHAVTSVDVIQYLHKVGIPN
jgi:S1-C subfamily serine protease